MKTNYEKVLEFMTIFKQEVLNSPTIPDEKIVNLRLNLISEEYNELVEAIKENDIVEIADALTDILYVVYGTGVSFGIDLDKCFDEVHSSNMSKLDENGKVLRREDGKIMKSSQYRKPDIKRVLNV